MKALKNSVIIIGGGVAGLGAAWKLSQEGIPVTVIEAKAHLGGRILTRHHGTVPIELGAEFIHGRDPALLKVISMAGLSIHQASGDYRLLEKGKLKRIKMWEEADNAIAKTDPRLPDLSFSDFISSPAFNDRTRRLATGFVEGFDAAYPGRIGAHSLLRAHYSSEKMDGSWAGRIDKGYSALVSFLAIEIKQNGGKLITGATARRIKWKQGAVEVCVSHRGKQEIYKASAAIFTLPLGVWKAGAMKMSPALPAKQSAVEGLQIGNVAKIVFVFREKWWPTSIKGFVQALDEPFPTWWTDPRGPVLTGWAGGPKADVILAFSKDIATLGLQTLSKIFSEPLSSLRSRLAASYTHNWAGDPNILGAYSYIPVNGLDLPKLLAEPVEDTLFFAGEATVDDAQTGTVFGAFESGLRVAGEVSARFDCATTPGGVV
jgi:monoamine oxidase